MNRVPNKRFGPSRLMGLMVLGLFFLFPSHSLNAQETGQDASPPSSTVIQTTGIQTTGIQTKEPEEETDTLPIPVMLELADVPTARVYLRQIEDGGRASAIQSAQSQLRQIETAQQALLRQAPLTDLPTLFTVQRVYNGVAVLAPPSQLDNLADMPGVVAVHRLPSYEVALSETISDLNIPALWQTVYTQFPPGDPVSIGIIDTGIDYLHTHLGGPGGGYQQNNTIVITDTMAGVQFPTAKVVGGYDFVGNGYDGRTAGNLLPSPDPDPLDCWGHGTHVAGIAGGVGVLKDGSAYSGPYTPGLDADLFSIGPGVAPQADLYALKIFGCSGVSQFVVPAIEWALDPNGDGDFSDQLDVLNLSLGSAFGGTTDVSAIALDNAAAAGMVVVAAAGNSGETYFITISPGVADRAISVAATNAGTTSGMASFSARGPRRPDNVLKPDISAPGVSIRSAAAGSGNRGANSSGTSMATPFVAGIAALLRQVHPDFSPEEIKALMMNQAEPTILANQSYPPQIYGPPRSGAGLVNPMRAASAPVIAYNADAIEQVSLSFGTPTVLDSYQQVANLRVVNKSAITQSFTAGYLPAIDLPGADVDLLGEDDVLLPPYASRTLAVHFSAQANAMRNLPDPTINRSGYFPRQFMTEEAGYLHLWPSETVAAAALSTGDYRLTGRVQWHPSDQRLESTVVLTASRPITLGKIGLSYGERMVQSLFPVGFYTDVLRANQPITLTGQSTIANEIGNWLAREQFELMVTSEQIPDAAGRGSESSSERAKNGDTNRNTSGNVSSNVSSNASSSANIREVQEATVTSAPLLLAAESGIPLHVPVYAVPRPTSAMRAAQRQFTFSAQTSATASLRLQGTGLLSAGSLAASRFPTDTVSVVAALRLQFSSPNEVSSAGVLEQADLRYVGVASSQSNLPLPVSRLDDQLLDDKRVGAGIGSENDLPSSDSDMLEESSPQESGSQESIAESRIVFGLSTYGDWSSPSSVIFNILFDTDEDGIYDYQLRTTNVGAFLGIGSNDEFFTVLDDLKSGETILTYFTNLISAGDFYTGMFNNSVLLLAVDSRDLGLDQENTDFAYTVVTRSRDAQEGSNIIDATSILTYDIAQPGVTVAGNSIGDLPIFYDLPDTTLELTVDRSTLINDPNPGLLLLHMHNDRPFRSEVVSFDFRWHLFLPLIRESDVAATGSGQQLFYLPLLMDGP